MYDIVNTEFKSYTYREWREYLEHNDSHRLQIDFSSEPKLSDSVRKLIFPSIAAFQKGEHSDGRCLLSAAEKFAKNKNQPEYTKAMSCFIKEENWHSAYLARYMNFHREPLKKNNILDTIFRRLRRTGGIHSEVSVLVTAEIIALSYYSALGRVGERIKSTALTAICSQMLHDELPHVIFQSYTLSYLRNTHADRFFRIALMNVASFAVWAFYGDLLREGGYSYQGFLSDNMYYLGQSIEISKKI